jgi:glyoxylase-like metal-dependent hydrolase (beta-lactamase superfamily II)
MSDSPSIQVSVLPVTPFQQNCSLLKCQTTGKGAVVDPGGDIPQLLDAIQQLDMEVEKIFVTHGHLDHSGGTQKLVDELHVPIEGPHKDDLFLIEKLAEQGQRYGFEGSDTFTPDRWLVEGDTIEFGAQTLEVLHCPGHTPGHLVFFHREARFAIVGDVIFNGSIGRTDLPRGNHEQLIESIRSKLWPLGDDVTFLPGHGDTSTFGWQRKCNPYVADIVFQ